MDFTKGHGTENDFVLLPDPDDELELTPSLVRALADRRAGIGADGVIRVGRVDGGWFMDYRNADGSIGAMCGNGVRVFGRYLVDRGLMPAGSFDVQTRDGIRRLHVPEAGDVTAEMGTPRWLDETPVVAGRKAVAIWTGAPHVVVPLADVGELDALDLMRPPAVDPPLPDGQNVDFAVPVGDRAIRMRVHERGVGETRSCGTGVCAVAAVAAHGAPGVWSVEVPGGRLSVSIDAAGALALTGPAVLVADGKVRIPRNGEK